MDKIYVYGASGHGLVVADVALACGYKEVVFVDDGKAGYQKFDDIKHDTDTPIIIAIGDNKIREKLQCNAKENGFALATLVHPSTIISSSASVGAGIVVMPGVIINAMADIQDGAILNTGCIIEHECIIGSFAHISPNVALAGNVKVGDFSHIGIGSSVVQGLSIGSSCIVGAGSVVAKNIDNKKLAYGNPCKVIKEIV